jgi:predicted MFS family arabinose efflux permease
VQNHDRAALSPPLLYPADSCHESAIKPARARCPELVTSEKRQRAFSIFYTGGVGAGALAPVLYGAMSDLLSIPMMMVLVAGVVLVTLPLVWWLRPHLRHA